MEELWADPTGGETVLSLPTADPHLDLELLGPLAKALLVWPNGARQPTAIVLASRMFETALDLHDIASHDIYALRRMVHTGEYLAVWCNGHVLVTDT